MANTDNARGLVPVRYIDGSREITVSRYTIASGYSENIFTGDPVKSTGTNKGIEIADAGDTARGVFVGVEWVNAAGEQEFLDYWPANTVGTDIYAKIVDAPDVLFEIQGDEDIIAADIGATADWVAGTGTASTGRSGYQLNSSDIGTGAGLLIYELSEKDNNEYGDNANVLVFINEHELRAPVTGV